jgi:hypothetical protein
MKKQTYYGTLTSNKSMITIVKVVDGGVLERRMIEITFLKSFLDAGDFKNAIHHMEHSTMSYYREDQLEPGCDEKRFNELYNYALKYFNP